MSSQHQLVELALDSAHLTASAVFTMFSTPHLASSLDPFWDCFPYKAETSLTGELTFFFDMPWVDTAILAYLLMALIRGALPSGYWVKAHKYLGSDPCPQRQICIKFSSQNWNSGCVYAFRNEFRQGSVAFSNRLPVASYKTPNTGFSRKQSTMKYRVWQK